MIITLNKIKPGLFYWFFLLQVNFFKFGLFSRKMTFRLKISICLNTPCLNYSLFRLLYFYFLLTNKLKSSPKTVWWFQTDSQLQDAEIIFNRTKVYLFGPHMFTNRTTKSWTETARIRKLPIFFKRLNVAIRQTNCLTGL